MSLFSDRLRSTLLLVPVLAFASGTATAHAPGERTAFAPVTCDYQCLTGFANDYMAALGKRDASRLKTRPDLRFTENNVEMPFGNDGLWATVTGIAGTALLAADTQTGQAAWIGTVEEHGLPVYFAVRLAVRDGAIAEAETVVVRTTGLPLPFGDVTKIQHDPAFNEILPVAQRRSRERLHAVADSYFSTVELNDGMVFAPFDLECARLENGLLTTAAPAGSNSGGSGNAAAISQGCEAQFRLGIYRINKRIRERRYPLIDVERGVVVSTGFFDHANEFDTYKTTDGVERKTLLKWPNSISLIEAFRIRDGRIHRIEAIFTYVPYFMHSPFYAYPPAPAPAPEPTALATEACDSACLTALADRYMDAMISKTPQDLPWSNEVRFTENSVGLQIGEGLWGSIRSKSPTALRIADPATKSVVWYGLISDHDAPAWFGMRLTASGKRIAAVETFVARARNPGPFGDAKTFAVDPRLTSTVAAGARSSRERMTALVEGYASTVERNDGRLFTEIDNACTRRENGAEVTRGKAGSAVIVKDAGTLAQGCKAQLQLGLYRPVDRVRNRRVLAIDEARGLVAVASFADFGVRDTRYPLSNGKLVETQDRYPSTREQLEIFRIENGKIVAIEAVSVFQPLRMPSAWRH